MSHPYPTETLTSLDIGSSGAANAAFGSDTSLLVARPGKMCCSFPLFWFTVPEGFYALVTRHGKQVNYKSGDGTETPVWPAGLHLGPPWLQVSHLVTKQSMIFNTPVRGCKTKDNVTVQIDIALVLRVMGDDPKDRPGDDPANVYRFVHEVTARGLQQQLYDAQAEAVRTLARSLTHTEVFGLRNVSHDELKMVQEQVLPGGGGGFSAGEVPVKSERSERTGVPFQSVFASVPGYDAGGAEEQKEEETEEEQGESERDMIGEHDEYDPVEAGFNVEAGASVTDAMQARLNSQFMPQGVEILDVIIQQIILPDEIQQQMSQKTMVISQNAEQRMQQKYDMLNLSQTEAIKTLKQSHDEAKMELRKDGEHAALQEQLKLQEEMARGEHAFFSITTQANVDVELVNAESNLTVQRIRDQTKLETERIKEMSEAESAVTMVNAEAEIKEMQAKAKLSCAELEAKGDKAIFHAEGVSAPKNRTLNNHTTSLQKLRAQGSLASNDKLIVTGTSGGKAANQMILADAALKDAQRGRRVAPDSSARSAILSEVAVASGKAQIRLNVWDDKNGSSNGPAPSRHTSSRHR